MSGFSIADGSATGSFVVSGSGIGEISSSLDSTDNNDVTDVFGSNPRGSKDAYAYSYFKNAYDGITSKNVSSSSCITNSKLYLRC